MSSSDSQPLITTVIPTYRRPAMLRRAIRSVLNQTFPDFRICVYDNASGDETQAVVEEFRKKDSRVEYVCRPSNIGAHRNFVDGANRVETPLFSFLPDDDILLPHFFETALNGFRQHPEAAMSALATMLTSPDGTFVGSWVLRWPEGLIEPPRGLFSTLHYGDPCLQAMLIRRQIWEEFGGFDPTTEPCGDMDFSMRVTARLPIVVSRKPGAIGSLHPGSTTVRTELNSAWPGMCRMAEKLSQDESLCPEIRQRASEILTRWMKRSLVTRGIMRSISLGKWEDAERAADLLVQECRQSRGARFIRGAIGTCRRFPGSPLLVRALFGMRAAEKTLLNLGMQWRFRSYSRFLRASTLAASTAHLASAVPGTSEDGGAAVPQDISAN